MYIQLNEQTGTEAMDAAHSPLEMRFLPISGVNGRYYSTVSFEILAGNDPPSKLMRPLESGFASWWNKQMRKRRYPYSRTRATVPSLPSGRQIAKKELLWK
jgi:hypothetical protein